MKKQNTFVESIQLCILGLCIGTAFSVAAEDKYFYQSEDVKKLGLPFSNAVVADDTIYLSGMIGRKPESAEPVPGGIVPETRQVMENIRDILKTLDAEMSDIVKCVAYLADMDEWAEMSKAYSEFFTGAPPARSAVAVKGLARNARVEIECIAVKDD